MPSQGAPGDGLEVDATLSALNETDILSYFITEDPELASYLSTTAAPPFDACASSSSPSSSDTSPNSSPAHASPLSPTSDDNLTPLNSVPVKQEPGDASISPPSCRGEAHTRTHEAATMPAKKRGHANSDSEEDATSLLSRDELLQLSGKEPETYAQASSQDEERQLKRQRRLIKNRESAQLSRMRKKIYIEDLERKVSTLTSTNDKLTQQVSTLALQNKTLREEVAYLHALIKQTPQLAATVPGLSLACASVGGACTSAPGAAGIGPVGLGMAPVAPGIGLVGLGVPGMVGLGMGGVGLGSIGLGPLAGLAPAAPVAPTTTSVTPATRRHNDAGGAVGASRNVKTAGVCLLIVLFSLGLFFNSNRLRLAAGPGGAPGMLRYTGRALQAVDDDLLDGPAPRGLLPAAAVPAGPTPHGVRVEELPGDVAAPPGRDAPVRKPLPPAPSAADKKRPVSIRDAAAAQAQAPAPAPRSVKKVRIQDEDGCIPASDKRHRVSDQEKATGLIAHPHAHAHAHPANSRDFLNGMNRTDVQGIRWRPNTSYLYCSDPQHVRTPEPIVGASTDDAEAGTPPTVSLLMPTSAFNGTLALPDYGENALLEINCQILNINVYPMYSISN